MSSHNQVCHNFAHQTGKHRNGGNMFYEDHGDGFSTVYSYGHHFGIATILPGNAYGMTALFTEADYSVTTSGHKSHVIGAISHFNIIRVPDVTTSYYQYSGGKERLITGRDAKGQAQEDFNYWKEELLELSGKHIRARKRDYTGQILRICYNLRKYVSLFKVKPYLTGTLRKIAYTNELSDNEILKLFIGKEAEKEAEERRQKERARRARELQKQIKAFRAFERSNVPDGSFTYLRLNDVYDDPRIETSKGIRIYSREFPDAKQIFRLAQQCKENGREWKTNGEQISINGYRIEKVCKSGLIMAGCHQIPYAESERIATKLGWK